ncbi:DUF2071 domain-containing protein [soil metagenome]
MKTATAASFESDAARRRILSRRGEPLFLARWDRVAFLHYEADPDELQRCVPFPLDLHDGRAFVSLVAFTMRGMRPRLGGSLGKWLLAPIATHAFLNVRTYVRHNGEPGIYFLAEWLSSRLATKLGPLTVGLPYRYGRTEYQHHHETRAVNGSVCATGGELHYSLDLASPTFATCEPHSLDAFLLERYTAFTRRGARRRFFRVWHEPWAQTPAIAKLHRDDLIATTGSWFRSARCLSANYSPGVDVWMGRPHRTS